MATSGSISHTIYDNLKQDILSLRLKPGQVLSENEFAKYFQVSRTPVHNAFAQLKAEGLVNVLPQRGTIVSYLDWDFIQQIIYMRTQVEIGVYTDIIYNWDEHLIEPLTKNLNRQLKIAPDDSSLDEFFALCDEFHGIFFASMGKEKLWKDVILTQYDYTRYRWLLYSIAQRRIDMYHEHLNLFNLICDKNISGIHRLIPLHHPTNGEFFPDELEQFKEYFYKGI